MAAEIDTPMAALAIDEASASSSSKPSKVVAMDQARRHCIGVKPKPFKDFPEGTWFKCGDEFVCKFCAEHLNLKVAPVSNSEQQAFRAFTISLISCCAATLNLYHTVTRKGPFQALVHSKKLAVPFYIARGQQESAKQGVGIYALPTQTDFEMILMIDVNGSDYNTASTERILSGRNAGEFSPDAFQINSIHVGERKVDLESLGIKSNTYITSGKVAIAGFAAGDANSFKFVSVTKGEKERKEVDAKVLAGYCEDNKIRCVLQRFKRIRAKPADCFGLDLLGGGATFGAFGASPPVMPQGYGQQAYGAAPPSFRAQPYSHSYGAPQASFMSTGSTGSYGAGASFGSLSQKLGGSSYSAPAPQQLSGGTTVSGGQRVDALKTQSTNDTFEKVGEPVEMVLQLGCFQTDQEKEADNKRMQDHEDGLDYWVGVGKQACAEESRTECEIRILQQKLSEIRSREYSARKEVATITGTESTHALRWEDFQTIDPEEVTATVKRQLQAEERAKQEDMMLKLE